VFKQPLAQNVHRLPYRAAAWLSPSLLPDVKRHTAKRHPRRKAVVGHVGRVRRDTEETRFPSRQAEPFAVVDPYIGGATFVRPHVELARAARGERAPRRLLRLPAMFLRRVPGGGFGDCRQTSTIFREHGSMKGRERTLEHRCAFIGALEILSQNANLSGQYPEHPIAVLLGSRW
jgi:hypothetical protein